MNGKFGRVNEFAVIAVGNTGSPSGGGGPYAVYGISSLLPVRKACRWWIVSTMSRTVELTARRGACSGVPEAEEYTSGAMGGSIGCWVNCSPLAKRG